VWTRAVSTRVAVEVLWNEANRPRVLESVLKDAAGEGGRGTERGLVPVELEVGRPPGPASGHSPGRAAGAEFRPLELPRWGRLLLLGEYCRQGGAVSEIQEERFS